MTVLELKEAVGLSQNLEKHQIVIISLDAEMDYAFNGTLSDYRSCSSLYALQSMIAYEVPMKDDDQHVFAWLTFKIPDESIKEPHGLETSTPYSESRRTGHKKNNIPYPRLTVLPRAHENYAALYTHVRHLLA